MTEQAKKIIYTALLMLLIFIVLPLVLYFGKYVEGVLVSLPFGIGLVFSLLVSTKGKLSWKKIFLYSFIPIALSILSSIIIAREGAICLIIMGVILLFPYYIGVVVGGLVQARIWVRNSILTITFAVLINSSTQVTEYKADKIIRDEIILNTTQAELWSQLTDTVHFGNSNDFFFRNGVSHPTSMFTTSTGEQNFLNIQYNNGFIQTPLFNYQNQVGFSFKLSDSLISMREKNIYQESHTMHLKNHFEVNYGSFKIEPINQGQCKLIAITNYKHKFEPEWYTNLWVSYFVHNLHQHVLTRIAHKIDYKANEQ